MVTWGDVIDIITFTFNIRQNELAKLLYCHKSKITRIKNGNGTPSDTSEEIFLRIFDPANPESPASSNEKSEFYLSLLREIIESHFTEIREALDDCWNEKDYKTFVLTLLNRAREGASTQKIHQYSKGNKKSAAFSNITTDEDCYRKQEKESLVKIPSEQMRKIFEQAVADYSIATYICKLPSYLTGDPFFAGDIFDFIDAIQTDVLSKFVNQQDDNIFKKISEFALALETYSGYLGMIQSSISEKYGVMCGVGITTCAIIDLIDSDYREIKNHLGDNAAAKGNMINYSKDSESEEKLLQLDYIRYVLLSHKQICELFEEICPGKTICVF